ncbi:MAG: fatty acid desaturase [Deltaproteobacteria bacterium]|nr:fatty acid desaturase [Deltaproteobacteria bacterium]
MKKKINWMNTLFLTLSPVVAIVGVGSLIWFNEIHWATWILAFSLAMLSGLGITAGYHRLLSHKSYEAAWPVRLVLLLLGAITFQNSALKWCSDHRRHHQFVDKDPDPYSITKGFWHAHIGWILYKEDEVPNYENVPDLLADPLVRFQHRFYLPLAVVTGLFLPAGIAFLWGDWLGGFFLAGFARVVMNHHLTFSINSFCHFIGRQPYSEKDSSRDSWILSFLTYGEGYHNFHHSFPTDFRNGIRSWHWDPSKWMITALSWIGQTKNLRRTPEPRILKSRLEMELLRLKRKSPNIPMERLLAVRTKCEEAYIRFCVMKQEYQKTKQEKLYVKMAELRTEMKKAKREFLQTRELWRNILKDSVSGLAQPQAE